MANVIWVEAIGKILSGVVGITIFLRWVLPAMIHLVRKSRDVAAALSALGPFMETARKDFKALDAFFRDLDARVKRIELNVGPNGGKSLYDSQRRVEDDLAFLKEAMTLDQVSPLFRATPSGQFEWVNDRFAELVNVPADDLLGNGWMSAICEQDREKVVREWESAVAHRRRFNMTFSILGHDGREVLVYCRAFPMSLHGEPRFFVGRIEPVIADRRKGRRAGE